MNLRALKLYGTAAPNPEQRVLSAGPVTATLENGQLRWIGIGQAEAIRAIAFVVRDRAWGTPVPEIHDLKIAERGGGFRVTFTAVCRTPDGNFTWRGDFAGKADGTIRCVGVGAPDRDFQTGRTGFVILHPLAGFVGRPVEIEHTDGVTEKAKVPEAIDPAQPFFLVRAMTHSPTRGVKVTVRMEGDSWEAEDQRNWTDASFKTYSRPLALPRPYTIKKGEEVRQTVTLTVTGRLPKKAAGADRRVQIELGRARGAMPRLGLSVLPEDAEAALAVADIVKAAGVQHLNCRVDLRDPNWRAPLSSYQALAKTALAEIVLEIILSGRNTPTSELKEVRQAARNAGLRPVAVVVTPAADLKSYPPGTPAPAGVPSWHDIASAARNVFPRARIGGGMLSNFTELNRKCPPKRLFDFVTHATSSLVHAADDRSVMEAIETIGHIIGSTKRIIGGTPYRIGPAHIGNSFNPYGASYPQNPHGERVAMARVDPRHRGLFGAAWHLGYLSQVADGGLEAATMASPVGEFGIAYLKLAHAQPLFDDDRNARVYPVFHVIRGLAAAAGARRIPARSSDASRVRAVAWRTGEKTVLFLANLRENPVQVTLPIAAKPGSAIWMLDATTFDEAIRDVGFGGRTTALSGKRLTLSPFAVARLEMRR
jgi:hypothetical protein